MSKLIGPLMALSARGTIADTLTYSGWKGIEYVRQRVIPSNPQTTSQQETRLCFKTLGQLWLQLQALGRAPWIANATGKPYTHRNALVKYNLPSIRGDANMQDFAGSPGSLAGLAPASISSAYGAPNITTTLGAPTLPPDWTIQAGVALCFPDQDPEVVFAGPIVEAEDATAPYAIVMDITSGPSGLYVCSAWFRFTRPDGRTAYGPSLSDTATKP